MKAMNKPLNEIDGVWGLFVFFFHVTGALIDVLRNLIPSKNFHGWKLSQCGSSKNLPHLANWGPLFRKQVSVCADRAINYDK